MLTLKFKSYNKQYVMKTNLILHCNLCVLKHCVNRIMYRGMYKSVLGKINKLQKKNIPNKAWHGIDSKK